MTSTDRSAKNSPYQDPSMKKHRHEIKNSLTPLKLAVDQIQTVLLKKHFDTYTTLIDSFNLINNAINALKRLSLNAPPMPQPFDIHPRPTETHLILKDIKSYLHHYPAIRSSFRDDGTVLLIQADRDKLHQAFSNLLENALHSLLLSSQKKEDHPHSFAG